MCGCNHKEIDFELSRLHSLISEKDRQIELLKARCCNDDLTLDMNSKASVILGKMIGESLDEAAQRVIDDSITLRADLARAREEDARLLLKVRDAIIQGDTDEAYHLIFMAASLIASDPHRPWEGLESRATLIPEQKGE